MPCSWNLTLLALFAAAWRSTVVAIEAASACLSPAASVAGSLVSVGGVDPVGIDRIHLPHRGTWRHDPASVSTEPCGLYDTTEGR